MTNEFGVLHNPVRTISKSSVSKFWRPNFSSDSISMEAQMRVVGQIGWYPANKTCINADYWARIVDNKAVQSLGDYSACYEVGLGYITNPEYADILFGTGDLPEICIQ
ncbi:MAG: hypothetical protein Athens071425_624 [Parcubacteria group bacterium Athens0714_25]|nr:MAG: hypothetical protein Athens071425_624 [Parcubacteria group bacterium Athens0714_25]